MASIALRQVDVALLGSDLNTFSPLKDVAVYTIGFTIGGIIEAPFNSLSKIGDSKITDAIHRNDFRLIQEVYYKSSRILMVIGALLFLGVCINIQTLLSFLPDKYEESYWVVILIGGTSFINMSTGLNTTLVYYTDKFKIGALLMVGLLVVSIVLNFLLIPHWGIYGAAIATGTALTIHNAIKTILIWKWYKLQPFERKPVIIVVGMLLVCLAINQYLPMLDNRYVDILYRSTLLTALYVSAVLFSGIFPEGNGFIKKYTGIAI
jgi:O-antigen/teichoic acid export membrane protein